MGTKCTRVNAVVIVVVMLGSMMLQNTNAQSESTSSTYGQEFFLGFMSSLCGSNLSVTVGTPGKSTRFTVETSNWNYNGTVTYGSPVVVYLPPELQITGSDYSNRQKAVHVYSQSRQQIFVLAESFVRNSHTAFQNYPHRLIEDLFLYEYLILSADDPTNNFRSEFLLVGGEDSTVISIVASQNISIPEDPQVSESSMTDVEADTVSHQFVLNRMQTLLILNDDDLTGSLVVSNKPLTVISGHECVEHLYPYFHFYCYFDYYNCEPLALQIHPIATWGTEFMTIAGETNRHQEIKGLTVIQRNFDVSITYGTGNYSYAYLPYPYSSNIYSQAFTLSIYSEFNYIKSVEQTYVAYMSTLGDPAFTMIPPIDQYVHDIDFVILSSGRFLFHYISITVLEEHFDLDGILLDGTPVDCEWRPICNDTTNYCYLDTDLILGYGCTTAISSDHSAPSQHRVAHSHPEGLLSVISYGYSLSPPRSYAYLTGHVLKTNKINISSIGLIDLSEFSNYVELVTESDGNSLRIDIPDGLVFGDRVQTSAYVNENGVISLGSSFSNAYPETFPVSGYNARDSFVVAPYWSDNDIRRSGSVKYINFSSDNSNAESEGRQLMDEVNAIVQAQQSKTEERFEGNWLLAAHWDHVHPSPHGEDVSGIDGIANDLEMTNNYQAIMVTDTLTTYVIFTYECGEMEWSRSGSNAAVIGFSAGELYSHNHPLSGTTYIKDAVRCSRSNVTNMFFTLPTTPNARDLIHRQRCLRKYKEERRFLQGTDVDNLARQLEPCPCTLLQAILDFGRYIRQSNTACFISNIPVSYYVPAGQHIQLTQQCCYNPYTGALITSQNGLAGTMLLYDPIRHPDEHQLWDFAFKDACCSGINSYCHKFFEQRPINRCDNYAPPDIGFGGGDPHYFTFDDRYHTFNGFGEFTLLEALQEGNNTPIYNLQGRLGRVSFWSVTTHLGFAFGHQQLAFQFDGQRSGFRVLQTRPGPVVDITAELVDGQLWYDETLEATLVKDRQRLTAAFFESGIVFTATVNQYISEYYMNFMVQVPRSRFQNRTQGFLGNLDSDPTNEFYRRGESTPITDHNLYDRQLYQTLSTWQTTEDESLFYYPNPRGRRQTYEDYQNTSFVPLFLDELTFTNEQRVACEANNQCLFDLAVTGDMQFARNTLNHEKDANRTEEELGNFPPNMSGNAVFRVNIGQESTYFLSVTDPDDTVSVTVEGITSYNSTLMNVEGGEYVYVLNLQSIQEYLQLVFVANDSRGAVAMLEPTVEICACANEGTCTRDGVITGNSTVVLNCQCTEAFSGPFCQEDHNGCADTRCFEGVECMDVPAPGTGAVCGPCPQGYTNVSQKCYDIDECSLNSTLCDQVCANTDGSYMCTCFEGYQLIEGTNQCRDINECDGINPCQQLCVNTEGSYTCSCTEGFSLHLSNGTCTANQACANGNQCSHGCALVRGRQQCFCPLGFELSQSGTQCIDVNECLRNPCGQLCTNTRGSFECDCISGFELQPDGKTCQDINECSETAQVGLNLCASDRNTNCINRNGSYECSCVPGYTRVNGICQSQNMEQPLPPPLVAIDLRGRQNSINFTVPTLSTATFTPDLQQRFRVVTAHVISTYCLVDLCNLIFPDGTIGIVSETINPMNVAIPVSLIGEDEMGQLKFTVFIQVSNGYLSKEHLNLATQNGEAEYRHAGFYQALPMTTVPESSLSQPVPTIFPGLSNLNSYYVIAISALVMVIVILCALIVTACSCYYKQQHEQKQGISKPLQLGDLYINESTDGDNRKPQEEAEANLHDDLKEQLRDETNPSQPEDKTVLSRNKAKTESEHDERNPPDSSAPQVETPKDNNKTWI